MHFWMDRLINKLFWCFNEDSNSFEDWLQWGEQGCHVFCPSIIWREQKLLLHLLLPTRHPLTILGGDLICTSLFPFFFFESKCCNFPCSYPYRLGEPLVWVRGVWSQISAFFLLLLLHLCDIKYLFSCLSFLPRSPTALPHQSRCQGTLPIW